MICWVLASSLLGVVSHVMALMVRYDDVGKKGAGKKEEEEEEED